MGNLRTRFISASGGGQAGAARGALLVGASALAIGLAAPAFAQDGATAQAEQVSAPATEDTGQEIVVTGIRASLNRAIDIKRNSSGVVDAISAEDIGKFPDTNLAESLQRITGVSVDRVNGEGSEVTVRGFGGGFNLVTLNGRTLPSANVATVGGDQNSDFASGTSRSFDFSNLASEGVRTLEVYKTARAAVPSGGIGATINIVTQRPLDDQLTGLRGSIGAKALYDTSVDSAVEDMDKITPELSGVLSWSDPGQTIGVSLFGSYQKRNYTTRAASSNAWNIRTFEQFVDPANGFVTADTEIENAPDDPNTLVSIPNDSRYHFAQGSRERINGQLVLQFRPTDSLEITADGLYAQNKQNERRGDQSNWFNRPFDQVRFDGSPVATTVFMHETIAGVKDEDFEQQYRAQKDQLYDLGLNAKWDIADNLTLSVDGHSGKSKSTPDNPNGASSTLVSFGANEVSSQSLDWSSGFPVQSIEINDSIKGNGNGEIDIGDLGSQVGRTVTSRQSQRINEVRADLGWDLGGGSQFAVGGTYRYAKMNQSRLQTEQTLGDWSVSRRGDIEQYAGDLIEQFCLVCKFERYEPGRGGALNTAFRGNAAALYDALSPVYADEGNAVRITANEDNQVVEKTWAAYGQLTWDGQIAGLDADLVIGARYEHTKVLSTSLVAVPTGIEWLSDNDFTVNVGDDVEPVTQTGEYGELLPAMDFKINLTDKLVGRVSWGKTLARPSYGNLFVASSVGQPPRPTAIGGIASGSTGNAGLKPLVSDNFDASLEWYFQPTSYVSVGFFDKRVRNFVGTGQTSQNLFGLRDPSSGAPGTRSGQALAALQGINADITDVNLFTMTALLQQTGSIGAATSQFQANFAGGALDQDFVNQVLTAENIAANGDDPLFQFAVTRPINNREGHIHGFEIAGQYFLGETGVGIAAAYTLVRGNIGIDVAADPSVDQFALEGLSDTANVTLIYDKYGLSARLAYNWRDKFLQSANRGGGDRNPVFVAPYGTLDFNISYDISDHLAVSLEGINLTQEDLRTYGRDETNLWFAQELDRRFLLGARYRF